MSVSRETKIDAYLALLQRWGRTLNLTSLKQNTEEALRDLVDDSLTLVPHLPADLDRLIDLGSGQGLPAVPIAIATGIAIELIEADRRKAAFLTTVMAHLGLKGHVWPTRIERISLQPAKCVTAKALAPLPTLIHMARPLLAPGGWCLFLKGKSADKEWPPGQTSDAVQVAFLPSPRPFSTIVKVSMLR